MDAAVKLHKLLDQMVNRSEAHSETRRLVNAIRKAAYLFKNHPEFDIWAEAILAEFDRPEGIPFVVDPSDLQKKGAKLESLDHVGPKDPNAPTIRRWVDKEGKPVVLNPTEDFGGSDEESHYAAPAKWEEIRKERESDG